MQAMILLSVQLSVTWLHYAIMAEKIDVLLGLEIGIQVLDGI